MARDNSKNARMNKLPGMFSDEEIAALKLAASKQKLNVSNYVRDRLGLPHVKMGTPVRIVKETKPEKVEK